MSFMAGQCLKSQFDNNDEKFIIDQFGKFLDMSKAYISSSDQLIAITKKLNFYVVKTVSDNQDLDKVLVYIKVFESPKYLKFYNEYTAKFHKTQNLSKQMIEKIYEISVLLQEFKLNEINQ